MTQAELNDLNKWLIYEAHLGGMPTLAWPEVREELSLYRRSWPPEPPSKGPHTSSEAYCWQKEPFWITWVAGAWDARYHGPEAILEDLQVLMLMDSL